jgi:GT2 family glycosyltransferase
MGKKVVCIPGSKVYHLGGGTLPKGNPKKTYLNFRNNLTMLYKNLPEKDLDHVMRVRFWLDYIAAFKELLTGKIGDFKAIIKARRDFYKWKSEFAVVRRQIQALRQTKEDPKISNFSILQKYYIFRKHTYDKIS